MKRKLFTLLFIISTNFLCFAHEHWIDLETFEPNLGQKTKVFVRSGHNFPKGEFVLGKNLLKELKVLTPDKKLQTFLLEQEKDARTAYVVFNTNGSYILYFVVSRPPENEEVYFGKSIVNIKEQTSVSTKVGNKLEIVLKQEGLQINKKIPFQVLFEEKPTKTTVSVSIDGKKNFFVQTDKEGIGYLELKYPGKYLLTTSYKKYGCSLTFFVPK
jgi:hypothetical protein